MHHSTYSSYQSGGPGVVGPGRGMDDGAGGAADESYRSINHAERMMRKMEAYHR